MEFDQLGEHWRRIGDPGEESNPAGDPTSDPTCDPTHDPAREIRAVRERAEALEQAIRRRDRRETAVALLLLPFFGWAAIFLDTPPVSSIGAWILVAACIVTPVRLRGARKDRPDPGRPLADALLAERDWIHGQARLLGSVVWWYVAPIAVGLILFVGGGHGPALPRALYSAVVLAFGAWIIRLNRNAARRELAPVADAIDRWLADLDAVDAASPDLHDPGHPDSAPPESDPSGRDTDHDPDPRNT